MSSPDPTTAAGGRRSAVAAMLEVTKSGLMKELHSLTLSMGLQVDSCLGIAQLICDAVQRIKDGKVRASHFKLSGSQPQLVADRHLQVAQLVCNDCIVLAICHCIVSHSKPRAPSPMQCATASG